MVSLEQWIPTSEQLLEWRMPYVNYANPTLADFDYITAKLLRMEIRGETTPLEIYAMLICEYLYTQDGWTGDLGDIYIYILNRIGTQFQAGDVTYIGKEIYWQNRTRQCARLMRAKDYLENIKKGTWKLTRWGAKAFFDSLILQRVACGYCRDKYTGMSIR